MLKSSLPHADSDPMLHDAFAQGFQLINEEASRWHRSYQIVSMALALSVAISIGVIVWFWLNEQGVCVILDHGLAH